MPYIPITEKEYEIMLKEIGVKDFNDLLTPIPEQALLLNKDIKLPGPYNEFEVYQKLKSLSKKNKTIDEYTSFLGAGAYSHIIPQIVNFVISRSEFATAYTPYQAEVSQGTLTAIYEYQSFISRLFDMDVSNASMYDVASALAESVHLARDVKKKEKVLIASTLHPFFKKTIYTYAYGLNVPIIEVEEKDGIVNIDSLNKLLKEDVAGFIVSHPNFYGNLEDMERISEIIHNSNTFLIMAADPISMAILKTPGEYGADIAVGEGQSLGIPISFGGPYLGIFTAKKEYIRKMPGRIIGRTKDIDGNEGFVMTLQTREQHIKRERATSNICSNQNLCALAATVFMSAVGPDGLKHAAYLSMEKAHKLSEKITNIKGFSLKYERPFFKEFVLQTPIPAAELVENMLSYNIFAGVPLNRFSKNRTNELLVACTERITDDDIEHYVDSLRKIR